MAFIYKITNDINNKGLYWRNGNWNRTSLAKHIQDL